MKLLLKIFLLLVITMLSVSTVYSAAINRQKRAAADGEISWLLTYLEVLIWKSPSYLDKLESTAVKYGG